MFEIFVQIRVRHSTVEEQYRDIDEETSGYMSYDRYRETNRCAIYGSLLIYLIILIARFFEPIGITAAGTDSLVIISLTAFSLLVVWPWFRGYFLRVYDDQRESPRDGSRSGLICFEIVALSAMLIYLLVQFQP